MDPVSNKISFDYIFDGDKNSISKKDRKDVNKILCVEATFTIKINAELYFEAPLAILEFYKYLYKWKERITEERIPEFHYYTIENPEEEGPLISLIPFSNMARVKTIWPEQDLYNVFDLNYIVNEFIQLEENLKRDIEEYYEIKIKHFLKHIPCIRIGYIDD